MCVCVLLINVLSSIEIGFTILHLTEAILLTYAQ